MKERNAPLVSRTLSVNRNDYIENLKRGDSKGNKFPQKLIRLIKKQLPKIFWLTEITLPDLYVANKTALISIITSKDGNEQIFIRFPKFCYLYMEKENDFWQIDLPTNSHFKLFERPNVEATYDW